MVSPKNKTFSSALKWIAIAVAVTMLGVNSCVRVSHKDRDVGIIQHWLFHRQANGK